MLFTTFAQYLQRLENTSKRLEITDLLTQLISELNENEIDKAIYMASGYLCAPFERIKFNLADRMMMRAIEMAYFTSSGSNLKEEIQLKYKVSGDLGNVVEDLALDNNNVPRTIEEVHTKLLEIATTEGSGSQDLKTQRTAALLNTMDKVSAKFTTRIVLGTTRLGFTELTIIDALAKLTGDKSAATKIEQHYNIHPDIGLIAKILKIKGIDGLKDINIETGVPVLSQKAQRVSGMDEAMERLKNVWAEFKFDGTRVQLHFDKSKEETATEQTELFASEQPRCMVRTFTRNLEETTHQYPDIVSAAHEQINAESVILDGEGIGYNKQTGEFLPFQETIQRKRKHNVSDTIKNIPIKYLVFDILYLNGESLVHKSLKERRDILRNVIGEGETIVIDEHLETDDIEELAEYFETAKEKNLEGLVLKSPEDPYQAGARSYSWIKLKKADEKLLSDSIDTVVLGYYAGKGARSKFGIGGFLVGVYDELNDVFKTVSKIGTGLKEEDWVKIKDLADKVKVDTLPANVEMNKIFLPDVITAPKIVVEIGADEISVSPTHSAGYALRFPRLLKFRDDKKPTETTTLEEIKKMFKDQREYIAHKVEK